MTEDANEKVLPGDSLKVHGHGETHSRNFCRFKLDIYSCIHNMSIWAS